MKIVKMNCPNCNGKLEINSNDKTTVCNYCGTTLAIDDGIIRVEHTINDNAENKKAKNAETFIKFGEYDKALKLYMELTEEYSYVADYWFKRIVCITENFDKDLLFSVDIDELDKLFKKYLVLEKDDNKKSKNEEIYKKFKDIPKEESNDENHESNEEVVQEKNKKSNPVISILIVIIIFLLIAFLAANKTAKNVPNNNELDDTEIIYDEDPGEQIYIRNADINDIKRIKGKTNVYIFWGEGCTYCEAAFNYFDSLRNEYSDYFNLYGFETWNNLDNTLILSLFTESLGVESSGVPYIVIGNEAFVGYEPNSSDRMLKAIKDNKNSNNDIYFNKVKRLYNAMNN